MATYPFELKVRIVAVSDRRGVVEVAFALERDDPSEVVALVGRTVSLAVLPLVYGESASFAERLGGHLLGRCEWLNEGREWTCPPDCPIEARGG